MGVLARGHMLLSTTIMIHRGSSLKIERSYPLFFLPSYQRATTLYASITTVSPTRLRTATGWGRPSDAGSL